MVGSSTFDNLNAHSLHHSGRRHCHPRGVRHDTDPFPQDIPFDGVVDAAKVG